MMMPPSGVRVWLAAGTTDMRRGMNGLALQVQQSLDRNPHVGDFYVFRGRRGDLVKILWHDGLGMSLYAKRLERGRFIWPSPAAGLLELPQLSSVTCWKESIGGTRNERGGQNWPDDVGLVASFQKFPRAGLRATMIRSSV